jgi:hypothetical protein
MANYDLEAIMDRLPVLQKAALAALSTPVVCDAVDFWPYQASAFPYWWNRADSMTVEYEPGGDSEIHRYQISMAMVIGHLGEGYTGEQSDKAYTWMAGVLDYFRQHKNLVDGTTYTTAPDWLWIVDGGARITGIPNGTRTLANSGLGVQQVAVVFNLEIPLLFEVY